MGKGSEGRCEARTREVEETSREKNVWHARGKWRGKSRENKVSRASQKKKERTMVALCTGWVAYLGVDLWHIVRNHQSQWLLWESRRRKLNCRHRRSMWRRTCRQYWEQQQPRLCGIQWPTWLGAVRWLGGVGVAQFGGVWMLEIKSPKISAKMSVNSKFREHRSNWFHKVVLSRPMFKVGFARENEHLGSVN